MALVEMLETLGPRQLCNIQVKPFRVEIDGYFFGLVYECIGAEEPDEPGSLFEYVILEPEDIMFHPPWESGEYST